MNCVVKQFAKISSKFFLGVVLILLLNVMEVLCVGGGDMLDRLCMVPPLVICVDWSLTSQVIQLFPSAYL